MCSSSDLIEVSGRREALEKARVRWAGSQSWGRMRSEEKKKPSRPRKPGQSQPVTESPTGSNFRCTPDLEHVLDYQEQRGEESSHRKLWGAVS